MNKLKLIELLSSAEENEVLVEIDGLQYEITDIGRVEEEFDGFCEVLPAAITLKVDKG